MKNIGLYIHFPFCTAKCPYCDFYSMPADEAVKEKYARAVIDTLGKYGDRRFDTVYFGGGTPSFSGKRNVAAIAAKAFSQTDGEAEFTVECNPSFIEDGFFELLRANGVNRISMGLQSADDAERKLLGRHSGAEAVLAAVKKIRSAGIENISLDLMLGVPGQTEESLLRSIEFCEAAGAKHISAYILKIEAGTVFDRIKSSLDLPGEDECASLYLFACEQAEKRGYMQYEISNFAQPGFESRHNLKYWHDEEYLGIGPAAHSFLDGERFYYERDINGFMAGAEPVSDGAGGDFEEYAMLCLRLTEGIKEEETIERFGFGIPAEMKKAAERFARSGLVVIDDRGIKLTKNGFLLSNSVIGSLIFSRN